MFGSTIYILGGLYEEIKDGGKELKINNHIESLVTSNNGCTWNDLGEIYDPSDSIDPTQWTTLSFHSFPCAAEKNPQSNCIFIFIFGGVNKSEQDRIEVNSFELKGQAMKLKLEKLELGDLKETEGFENVPTICEKKTNNIWIVGKSQLHCLNLKEFTKPIWSSKKEWQKLDM